jgi:hypothetical protein
MATEMSTNALGLTFCVINADLPTTTIFSASYSLCHKVSLQEEPYQCFFSIKRIGKDTVIPVHVMKAYGRNEVELHTFSSSQLHGSELLASYPARLTVGDRVGPRDCLDPSEKKYRFFLQEIEKRFLERRTRGPDIIPTALSILTNVSAEVSVLKVVLMVS